MQISLKTNFFTKVLKNELHFCFTILFIFFLSPLIISSNEDSLSNETSISENQIEAEIISKPIRKLRFFNIDCHISVIADIKHIFESMGHEVVDWSISGHTWVFNRPRSVVEVINENTWGGLNQQMCDKFYERYKDYLSQFDGFIVTYPPTLALIYEKFNKPIIVDIPIRYECPFWQSPGSWEWVNNFFKEGVKRNKIFLVANNKGDQAYLKYYTGLESVHIPSLCEYTNVKYSGHVPGFYCHALWDHNNFNSLIHNELSNSGLLASLPWGYRWWQLYERQGVIHFPYQISTMSTFEQYTANVPLFFPSKTFLRELHYSYPKSVLSQLTFFEDFKRAPACYPGDLNNIHDPEVLNFWIESADYYDQENMPYIQYFNSFDELKHLLRTVNLNEISEKMKQHNVQRKEKVYKQWEEILRKVAESCDS